MIGNVRKTLQNECLACCLHKYLKIKINLCFGPEFTSILIDIGLTKMLLVRSSVILHNFGSGSIFIYFFQSPHFEILPNVT